MSLIYPNEQHQTMGTPTALVDLDTDTIFLFLCVNFKHVLLLNSTDGGMHWSSPQNLTQDLVPSSWSSVYYGTQQGITLEMPNGKKRLVVCANHHGGDNGANTVYSDDHGLTWKNGQTVPPSNLGECSLAQTSGDMIVWFYCICWHTCTYHTTTRPPFMQRTQTCAHACVRPCQLG
jgi:hypothetical protein